MHLTTEQLKEVESFASLAFSPRDIAVILCIPVDDFEQLFAIETSPIFLAFERGRLKALKDLRAAIYNTAISGSSPAQAEIIKLFKSQSTEINKFYA